MQRTWSVPSMGCHCGLIAASAAVSLSAGLLVVSATSSSAIPAADTGQRSALLSCTIHGTDLLTADGANTVRLRQTSIANPSWANILTGAWAKTADVSNDMFTPWSYDRWVHLLPETLASDYVSGWAGYKGDDMFFPGPGAGILVGGPGHDVLIGQPDEQPGCTQAGGPADRSRVAKVGRASVVQ